MSVNGNWWYSGVIILLVLNNDIFDSEELGFRFIHWASILYEWICMCIWRWCFKILKDLFYVLATSIVISVWAQQIHGDVIVLPHCCCFPSKHHVWSYQHRYWLLSVRTRGDFIVLNHWDTRLPQSWPNVPHCPDIVLSSPCPYPVNAEHQAKLVSSEMCQYDKYLVWLGWDSNSRSSTLEVWPLPIRFR